LIGSNPLLYKNGLYLNDFRDSLQQMGIRRGQTLLIHSDMAAFGKPIRDKKRLMNSIIEMFKDLVGETGTIVMPTFTYSFCKGQEYDVNESRSTVGALTEFFRKTEGVVRTIHPLFSVAIWGGNKEFLKNVSHDSFGIDSIFDKIKKINSKMVAFGSTFSQSFTFIHHIEQIHGVPHRFIKTFEGIIRNGKSKKKSNADYYVRYLDKNVNPNFDNFETYLLSKQLMEKRYIGNASILVVDTKTIFEEGMKQLEQDVFYFLKNNPDIEVENCE